jgi:hypothetical protein
MEPTSIRLLGHALYSLAIALILSASPIGTTVTLPMQALLVLAGIALAAMFVATVLLSWPPSRHALLGVALYAVVAGALYLTHDSGLAPIAQLGFALLFTRQAVMATAAYLRATRIFERQAEAAVHG